VTVVAGACFVVLAWRAVPWVQPPAPASVEDYFTAGEIARADHFSAWARLWSWSSLVLQLLVLALFVTPWARRMLGRILRGPDWLRVLGAVVVVSVTVRLVTLPLAAAAQQHRLVHGLSVQGWTSWSRDVVVSLALSTLMAAVALTVLVAARATWKRWWPVVVSGLLAGTVVVASWGYPLVVEPLFNSFTSMEDGDLRDEVMELAESQGVPLDDVLVADASRRTTTLNAYVSGLGGTRRVVVYDTLLEQAPAEQVLSVVAHELAHARHRDVAVGTALGALGAAVGAGLLPWVLRRRDVVAVVTTVLAVTGWASVLIAPIENGISRQVEMRADVDALKAIGDPVAFVEMQRMLAVRALADPTPPAWSHWWFSSHPGVLTRVALAEVRCCGTRWPEQ
jgi:STE24 endopeptidase